MANYAQPQIDAKNLSYLEDTLTYEALACKKCAQYETMLTDPAQKNMAHQLAQHHRQHFDALYNYLQSHQ
jgi:hypothetical protein